MNNMPIWDFDIEKHALWLYGGHPFFPASSDVYDKMQQLFTFCDEVWQKARLTTKGFDGMLCWSIKFFGRHSNGDNLHLILQMISL